VQFARCEVEDLEVSPRVKVEAWEASCILLEGDLLETAINFGEENLQNNFFWFYILALREGIPDIKSVCTHTIDRTHPYNGIL